MPLPTPLRRLAALTARTAERAAGSPMHAGAAVRRGGDGAGAETNEHATNHLDSAQAPEDPVQAPEDPAQAPEDPAQAPESSVQAPEDSLQAPGGRAEGHRDRAGAVAGSPGGPAGGPDGAPGRAADGPVQPGGTAGQPAARTEQPAPETAAPGAEQAPAAREQESGKADRDPVDESAEQAGALARRTGGLGGLGRPINKQSPFFIGMTAAAGVAVTYAVAVLVLRARGILILIGLALFIAAGLDRAVERLTRHGWRRPVAVVVILLVCFGAFAAFVGAAIPPLASQGASLVHEMPHLLHELQNHNTQLGKLNQHYQIEQRVMTLLKSRGTTLAGGVLGAGQVVLSTAESVLVVAVLVIYFLASFPSIKSFIFRLWPKSRRPRAILIGEEIFSKVGGFMAGNVITSLIAGVGTYVWMLALGIPYPLLFSILVALLDLIPVIGSTIGGVAVTLVALTVSLGVAIGTLVFYVAYRLAEDYLIVPRVMGQTVAVPAVVTLVATLIGGTLLGIIGALVAIPAAAAIHLLLKELAFRRLDSS